ncbi:DUF4065 domain-containing protein [Moraxella bovis]|uniref:DUF4065 domain-containing protein n=3 Tax=Moraxella bovis TaxID=476 RepID=A0AAQ2Q4P2_MORBO|nr:type II toxin-antitoxin system antitoxin SocA domain-containing protein [Moraxella bovis]AWY21255.1 hypothetical protein DQF64_12645 [Moraxella bovis]UYZ78613.1 DUF4065 domain-containing protein [Moraxella bovis]UYZ89202.1 DUF4065 domain-containing protein [Moraxella bovis]UYZ92524.1 DUF4065 domain-containing protein [Moraxella bovis]UYZ95695.1 DUF4065 domain-containing protein [Moraxella bovis]
MVSSIAVANQFIRLAKQDGKYLTPMQILKLVYIAHGWSYGFFNKPLIDDTIEAWKYGPVIPELYQTIKKYGNTEITQDISYPWLGIGNILNNNQLDDDQQKVVNFVYKKYGHFDGIQLSMLTHQNNTPWSEIFNPHSWGDVIPNHTIHKHYKQLYNQLVATYEQQHSNNQSTIH